MPAREFEKDLRRSVVGIVIDENDLPLEIPEQIVEPPDHQRDILALPVGGNNDGDPQAGRMEISLRHEVGTRKTAHPITGWLLPIWLEYGATGRCVQWRFEEVA